MQELLESLGLTAYEARALGHLLRHGPRTGPDLAHETAIPTGRVYDTLNALAERGLASSRPGRPRLWEAAPAQTIPARLLAALKRRAEEGERAVEGHAAALERELSRLPSAAAPGPAHYGVRLGEDAGRSLLVEATHAARDRVDAYLALESVRDDDLQLFDAFRQAVARGVRTRILLRSDDVEYLMATPYVAQVLDALLPHLGQTLQVRLAQGGDSPAFSVLDGRRVMVGVRSPLEPERYLAVVHMEDAGFAQGLLQKFDELWEGAELDRSVVQRVLRKLQEEGTATPTGRFLEKMVRKRAAKAAGREARRPE